MALNAMGLGVTFTARDAMSGTLNRLQRAFSGLEVTSKAAVAGIGAGFGAMAAGIGMTVAGLASLEGALNIASAAGRFEAQLQKIGQVANVKTPEGLAQMSDAVLNASQSSGFGTQEVGQGLEDIAAMGFTATQSMQMLTPALGLAAAGTISVADAAGAMGSAMKVFGLATDEATMNETASKLLGIANTTALQAQDLRIALGTVGRGASAAKQNLDEMLISMGLVKNTGVDATVAASSVSSALLYMAEKSKEFKKIGVSVTDAEGNFRNFIDVVLDVHGALGEVGDDAKKVAQIKALFQRFGITAYQGIVTQLQTGIFDEATGKTYYMAEAVAHLRREQKRFAEENIVMQYATKMFNNFDGTLKRIKATWETLVISVGSGFAEAILPMARLLLNALIEVEHFIRRIPAPAKKAMAAFFLLGSAMMVAAGAATLLAGGITVIGAAITLASPELLAFLSGMLIATGPLAAFAAVLTAVGVAIGAATWAALHWNLGGSWDSLVAFYNKWKTVFSAVVTFLSKGELTGALAEEFMALDSETQNMVANLALFGKKIEVWVTAFVERFKELFGGEAMQGSLGKMFDAFMRLAAAIGLIDSKSYEMSKTLGGDDFAVKGKLAAEAVAKAFEKIADAVTLVINALTFLKKIDDHLPSTGNPVGLPGSEFEKPGLIRRWLFGMKDPEEDTETASAQETLTEAARIKAAQKSYDSLPYQQRMYASSLTGSAANSTDQTAALMRVVEDSRFREKLFEKNPGLRDSIQVNVILDGEKIGEAHATYQDDKAAGMFTAERPTR